MPEKCGKMAECQSKIVLTYSRATREINAKIMENIQNPWENAVHFDFDSK